MPPNIEDDDDWRSWRDEWPIRPDTVYLNHGSFGPTPRRVRECQQMWQQELASQPMDFFVRKYEPAWLAARRRLAEFVATQPENLAFMENATAAMNAVAYSFPLGKLDEVLLSDHEYGAVVRIWQRACRAAGTAEPQIAKLPARFESADQVVDAVFSAATDRTRLLVVSHITSPTAVILPVHEICREAKRRGIAVCIDGPHAPAQIPLSLDELDCDFYTASLHKWVSAPIGSGFLFACAQVAAAREASRSELGPAGASEADGVVGRVRLVGHARSVGVPGIGCGDGLARRCRAGEFSRPFPLPGAVCSPADHRIDGA